MFFDGNLTELGERYKNILEKGREAGGKSKLDIPSIYLVVLNNDPINGFDFVVRTLSSVFNYGAVKAFWLTFKAHVAGKSIVWRGNREIAVSRVKQIKDIGPDPQKIFHGAKPLDVKLEKAE